MELPLRQLHGGPHHPLRGGAAHAILAGGQRVRLAGVLPLEADEVVGAALDRVGEVEQRLLALGRGGLAPLREGGVSAPIEGRFGITIVRVAKIEPGKERSFQDVAGELKKELALERARAQISSLHDKFEDERGAGAPLADIAKKLNLPTRTIDAVDRSGRNPEGGPVTGLPQGVDLISNAFTTDVGAENDAPEAVMALTTDAPVPPEVVEEITGREDFHRGKAVDF